MRKISICIGTVLVAASIALSGCGAAKTEAPKAPLVKTMVVGASAQNVKNTFSGTVHGYFESPLAFQVGGRIMQRYVQSGERVTAGQPLFRVDSKDAEEAVAAAQASVTSAQASYNLAASTLKRYEKLHDQAAISDLAMDQTRNQFELAEAQLNNANATLARAENNLGFTLLTADRDGIVGSTLYEVGQVVSAGTPVVSIIDDSKLDVYISFTEKQMADYGVGMPATVTFWAMPGVTATGHVREIAAAPNTSTGTYDTKVTLDEVPPKTQVGMTAEVKFDRSGSEKGVMVPLTAMATQSSDPSVWVVKDGKVSLRQVMVGSYGEDQVEVLSGLNDGDRVVTAGVDKLTEGEEVRL